MKLICGAEDRFYFRRGLRHIIYEEFDQAVTDRFLDKLVAHIKICKEDIEKYEVKP